MTAHVVPRPVPAPVAVRSIATAVPATVLHQDSSRDLLMAQPGTTALSKRLIGTVFDASAIERRHTVLEELGVPRSSDFLDATTGTLLTPSTGRRNALYAARIRPLLLEAAVEAISSSGLEPADITHVVTVSCTGFFAPGPDYLLVRDLGLRRDTRRLHVGFMGCYGAFPALRAALSTCRAEPDAVVLVVCVELCTLHVRASNDPDTIVASSVFSDGAAAAVVTARPAPAGVTVLEIDSLETVLTDGGEADMAWTIGDQGFEMVLSSYVPKILEQQIAAALHPLLDRSAAVDRWAVHPGGRAILDRVQRALGLAESDLAPSREVLRDFGNMSSATVLFILRDLLHTSVSRPETVLAMAFGPGLTVESGLFTQRVVA